VLLADVNYVGLGAERDAEIASQTVEVDMDYDQWIIELSGGYRATPKVDTAVRGSLLHPGYGRTEDTIEAWSLGAFIRVPRNWRSRQRSVSRAAGRAGRATATDFGPLL